MFGEVDEKEVVISQLYMYKAKVLAVTGEMNAKTPHPSVTDFMESIIGVITSAIDASKQNHAFLIQTCHVDLADHPSFNDFPF